MFRYNIRIANPKAGNEHISPKEVKSISDLTKKYYREPYLDYGNARISNYEVHLLYCYLWVRANEVARKIGTEKHKDVSDMREQAKNMLNAFYDRLLLDNYRIVTQLSNPDQKYYGIHTRPAAICKDNPCMELVTEVYGIPACKSIVEICGNRRPAFRLGKATSEKPVQWITVNVSLLGSFYTGNRPALDVYIQSHALSRLKERLDLLNEESINYSLWENTHDISQFVFYRGYLLLPFSVFNVKIGYLVANVVEEKLLFRTFLFITHNCTPEGDRLKRMTGLEDKDISYWRIDRLSTFVKLKEAKYPALIRLFCKAGLADLMHLRDKKFTIDTMQTANLDSLAEYIYQGIVELQMYA